MSELDEIIERIEHWKEKSGVEQEDWIYVYDGPQLYRIATEQREQIRELRELIDEIWNTEPNTEEEIEEQDRKVRAVLDKYGGEQ